MALLDYLRGALIEMGEGMDLPDNFEAAVNALGYELIIVPKRDPDAKPRKEIDRIKEREAEKWARLES